MGRLTNNMFSEMKHAEICRHMGRLAKNMFSEMKHAETCRDPGSNRGPSDLQSDALPTELSRLDDPRGLPRMTKEMPPREINGASEALRKT